MFTFFLRFGGVFSYYFWISFLPQSLSSPSDTAIRQILIYLMVPHKSLRLSSCLSIFFFLFVLWTWLISNDLLKFTDSFFCWSGLLWFPSSEIFSSVNYILQFLNSIWLPFIVFSLWWYSHFAHCFSDFIWLLTFVCSTLNFLIYFEFFAYVIHKSPFLYNQFKEIYFVPLIWVT